MSNLLEALDRPPPTLIVTVTGLTTPETMQDIAMLSPAPVVELRADMLHNQSPGVIRNKVVKLAELPLLLTIRHQDEGGEWQGSEPERLKLYENLLKEKPNAPNFGGADGEAASEIFKDLSEVAHDLGKIIIGSVHLPETPSVSILEELLAKSQQLGADWTKIVTTTNTMDDVRRLADFTLMHANERIITLGMGRLGPLTRITLPAAGSDATYAHSGDEKVAVGMMHYKPTHEIYTILYPDYASLANAA